MSIYFAKWFESRSLTLPQCAINLLKSRRSGNKFATSRKSEIDLAMLNSQRIFVDAVRKYCATHGIAIELRSEGWLIVHERGGKRRFAFGYDLGLNSAVAHRIANDKAATAEVLELCGIACIPHTLFLSPQAQRTCSRSGSWEAMLRSAEADIRKGSSSSPTRAPAASSVFMVSTRAGARIGGATRFSPRIEPRDLALCGDRGRGPRGPDRRPAGRRLQQGPAVGHRRRHAFVLELALRRHRPNRSTVLSA